MGQRSPRCQPCDELRRENLGVDGERDGRARPRPESTTTSARAGRPTGRLADEVYDTLLGQLMSLRIVPDSRVTIDALARELGVSQTPIRDALNRLEADGLVVRVPNAGYRIPPQITRAAGSRTWSRFACCSSLPQRATPRSVPRRAGRRPASDAGGHGGAGRGRRAPGLRRLRPARRRLPRPPRRERGQPADAGSARPTAHSRAPVPARLRHRGHLPGHGRARRDPGGRRGSRRRCRRLRDASAHPAVRRSVPAPLRRRRTGRTDRAQSGSTREPTSRHSWLRIRIRSDRILSHRVHHCKCKETRRCPERCS